MLPQPIPHLTAQRARAWREGPGEETGRGSAARPALAQRERGQPENAAASDAAILCAACAATITSPRERSEQQGAHAHTFLNPAGMVFRIRCFASAPGSVALGETSDYWTWFSGFHWQACICRQCFEHLGWAFTRPGERFYGLIAERIVERDEPGERRR